jgi:ATP-dependent RNA helicase RhlE
MLQNSDIRFADLKLSSQIQQAIVETGYEIPTPIQRQAIPLILEGHDLLGIAQTGTGKTAAFCLPILNSLQSRQNRREPRSPRSLILTPTRELAVQIHKNLLTYGKHLKQRYAVIFGGVGQGNQVRDLREGVDILVATPGRLLDLIEQKHLRLDKIEIFVLDEADRMLDMGFLPDIKRVLPLLPGRRHNLFFSATMPNEINKLAHSILKDPKKVEVTPPATTVERIKQTVMFVEKKDKPNLLVHALKSNDLYKVLVFRFANATPDTLDDPNKTLTRLDKHKIKNTRNVNTNSRNAISGNSNKVIARCKLIITFFSIICFGSPRHKNCISNLTYQCLAWGDTIY